MRHVTQCRTERTSVPINMIFRITEVTQRFKVIDRGPIKKVQGTQLAVRAVYDSLHAALHSHKVVVLARVSVLSFGIQNE